MNLFPQFTAQMPRVLPVSGAAILLATLAACAQPPQKPADPLTPSADLPPDLKQLLETVQQRRPLRPGETEAYYAILAHARDTNYAAQKLKGAENLKRHQREFRAKVKDPRRKYALEVDLFNKPQDHAGELVTLGGYVRRLIAMPADENKHGLTTLYEAWLFTEDSQQHPLVIVCSSIPEGIPTGAEVDKLSHVGGIEVTGYFFKNFIYTAHDANRFAPLILAQRLEWHPPPEPKRLENGFWYGLAGGIFIVLLLLVCRMGGPRKTVRAPEAFDPNIVRDLAKDIDQGIVVPGADDNG